MKVEKLKPKEVFAPVQITLETKEEADRMWHVLNYAPSYKDYLGSSKGITTRDLSRFHTALWETFNLKHSLSDC